MNNRIIYVCYGCKVPCITQQPDGQRCCPSFDKDVNEQWIATSDLDNPLNRRASRTDEKLNNCRFSGLCGFESMLGGFPNCYQPFPNKDIVCWHYEKHCNCDPEVCIGDTGDIQCRTCEGCVLSKEEMAHAHGIYISH